MVIGTVPGRHRGALVFKDAIESSFENLSHVVGVSLGITGVWLSGDVAVRRRRAAPSMGSDCKTRSSSGSARAPRSRPGISRSGSTIGAALCDGPFARCGGAVLVSAVDPRDPRRGGVQLEGRGAAIESGAWVGYAAGFLTAFAIGYVAIGIVIKFLETQRFHLFGYYCLGLGGAVLVYVALGNA